MSDTRSSHQATWHTFNPQKSRVHPSIGTRSSLNRHAFRVTTFLLSHVQPSKFSTFFGHKNHPKKAVKNLKIIQWMHIICIYLGVEGESWGSISSEVKSKKPRSPLESKWSMSRGNRNNFTYNALIFMVESLFASQDTSGVNALGLIILLMR